MYAYASHFLELMNILFISKVKSLVLNRWSHIVEAPIPNQDLIGNL